MLRYKELIGCGEEEEAGCPRALVSQQMFAGVAEVCFFAKVRVIPSCALSDVRRNVRTQPA